MKARWRGLALLACCAMRAALAEQATLAACAAHALPEHSMRQSQLVRIISDSGWSRESQRTVYWQRTDDGTIKVLFVVERPKTEAGLKLLVVQHPKLDPVITVFSPELNRARRVVGSGASNSVLGTDFTFEDALYLQRFLSADGTHEVGDARLDGHEVLVAESRPNEDDSAYSLIRTYVDKDNCLPIKTEFYGPSGNLDKTLTLPRDGIETHDGRAIARQWVMDNHKQHQRTELTISAIDINIELPAALFSLAEIEKSH